MNNNEEINRMLERNKPPDIFWQGKQFSWISNTENKKESIERNRELFGQIILGDPSKACIYKDENHARSIGKIGIYVENEEKAWQTYMANIKFPKVNK